MTVYVIEDSSKIQFEQEVEAVFRRHNVERIEYFITCADGIIYHAIVMFKSHHER